MVQEKEESSAETESPVSLKEKIGYGLGDLGFNFYWANISAFLLIFYTDTFGISAAAAGTMMLVSKVIDAFADPLIGAAADRTKSRFGHFRPYLIWGTIPLAVAGVLAYSTPDFSESGKLIWAYITFSFMMIMYSVINVPYSALSGVITAKSQERTTLISFRFIAAFTGTILVNYFTLSLVKWLGRGNETLGWQLTMALYGIIASTIFIWVFLSTRERIKPPPHQKTKISGDIKDLLNNRPWMVLFSLALIIMITITVRSGASVYYIKYYVNKPELIKYFLTSYGIALAVGASITPLLTRFIDKKRLMVILMTITGILSFSFFFIPKDAIVLLFTVNILIGLALGPKSPLAFSMYADTADYTEWKTGRRATGMTFAAANFSQKLGGALASFIIGSVLTALGYVANTAQSDASQTGIVVLMSIIPGIFALLAAFSMKFYKLDNIKLVTIQTDLKNRKAKDA
jgi:GPH family glycoside/pentoside/hexuronide:cation symporter